MFYKTPKDSETGRKFSELFEKVNSARKQIFDFLEKWGIDEYSHSPMYLAGGIDYVANPKIELNPKEWIPVKNKKSAYKPNPRTKEGKEIVKSLRQLPNVQVGELNSCINWNSRFKHIGFRIGDDGFFYFEASEKFFEPSDWADMLIIPNDCIEITYSEYKSK